MFTELNKINGFSRSMHPFQIFSYVVFFEIVANFSACIMPSTHEMAIQIPGGILFYFFAFTTAYYALMASYIDPTDESVIEAKQRRQMNLQAGVIDQESLEYFCNQCDSHVSGLSKHCKVCDRCVRKFDHHCKWLNNCIGDKNYRQFFRLIVSVCLFASTFIIFSLITTLLYTDNLGCQIWTLTNAGVIALLFILDFNLVLFHIYLQAIGLSTYDYIVKRRSKSDEKNKIQTNENIEVKNFQSKSSTQCFWFSSRQSRIAVLQSGQQSPQQHKVIDILSQKGLCNEVEVVNTQMIDNPTKDRKLDSIIHTPQKTEKKKPLTALQNIFISGEDERRECSSKTENSHEDLPRVENNFFSNCEEIQEDGQQPQQQQQKKSKRNKSFTQHIN